MKAMLIGFCVFLSACSAVLRADTFVFAAPEDAPRAKAIVDTIRLAYQRLGHDIELSLLPAKRSLLHAQHDLSVDGELARIAEAQSELPSLIRVPVPIIEVPLQALSYTLDRPIPSFNELGQYKLVAVRGVVFTDNALKHLDTSYVNDMAQALALLDSKRVDLLIVPGLFAKAPDVASRNLYLHPAPFEPVKIYHYLNQRHAALVPDLSRAMSEVTGNPVEGLPAQTDNDRVSR